MSAPHAADPAWLRAHRFWAVACREASAGRLDLKRLRDIAEALPERPLWQLAAMQLPRPSIGRLGFVTLLQAAERSSGDARFAELLVALGRWREGTFESFAAIARALGPCLAEWIGPTVLAPSSDARAMLEALGACRQQENLASTRHGVLIAAGIGAKREAQRVLARPELSLVAGTLTLDLVVIAVEAAAKARAQSGGGNERSGWPEADVMLRNALPLAATAHAPRVSPLSTPMGDDRVDEGASRIDDRVRQGSKESWWHTCEAWACDEERRLEDVLELSRRLTELRLWELIDAELGGLGVAKTMRLQARGRTALAALLDEFVRAFPSRGSALLDLIVPRANVQVRIEHIGGLWQELEPLFSGWARTLQPGSRDSFAEILHRHGDILPWQELPPIERERFQASAIERVVGPREHHPETVREGVFWVAKWARNDLAHGKTQRLAGRAPAVEMLLDVVSLACLAALRFRRKLTPVSGDKPSLPDIAVIVVPKTAGPRAPR